MNKIKCPFCDTEYLPGEIYLPKHFLGQPIDIERDIAGNILWSDGVPQNLTESFICHHCNKKFKVEAEISYKTSLEANIDEPYTTVKYMDRITLKEID